MELEGHLEVSARQWQFKFTQNLNVVYPPEARLQEYMVFTEDVEYSMVPTPGNPPGTILEQSLLVGLWITEYTSA